MSAGQPRVGYFSERDVTALTGLSRRRLHRWSKAGILRPANRRDDDDAPVSLYDFRDLVGLKVLARFNRRLPVERLRAIGGYLSRYSDRPWSQLRFHVAGSEVLFFDPDDGKLTSTSPLGQLANAELVSLSSVAQETEADVINLRTRSVHGSVASARDIQGNQPVISGTRVPTEAVWSFHEQGCDEAQIVAEYPSLTAEDVRAAIEFEVKRRSA